MEPIVTGVSAKGIGKAKVGWVKCNETHHPNIFVIRYRNA